MASVLSLIKQNLSKNNETLHGVDPLQNNQILKQNVNPSQINNNSNNQILK